MKNQWVDKSIVSCGNLLRWRASVVEHKCPYCHRYSQRWAGVCESEYCSNCGKKLSDGGYANDLI